MDKQEHILPAPEAAEDPRRARVLDELTRALWAGAPLRALAAVLCRALDSPVYIYDFAFNALASALPPGTDPAGVDTGSLESAFRSAARTQQALWYNANRSSIENDAPGICKCAGGDWLLGAARYEKLTVAWVAVCRAGQEADGGAAELVRLLCGTVAIRLKLQEVSAAELSKTQDLFLRELLSDHVLSADALDNYTSQLGISPGQRFCVIAVRLEERNVEARAVPFILQQVRSQFPADPVVLWGSHIVILIRAEADQGGILNNKFVLREYLAVHKLRSGMSRPFSDLRQTRAHFAQAADTIDALGQLYPDEILIRFQRDLGAQMIHRLSRQEDVSLYEHPALAVLDAADAKNGGALLHTLETYLRCGCSLSRTARALFIHRNTLNKRMERIRALTGLDLEQGDTLGQLHMSFAIRRCLRLNAPKAL